MKAIFAQHGIPELMSDNMPYASKEFHQFASEWNIKLTTSSTLYPQSNGQNERFVQTVKQHCAKKPVTTMLTYPWKCTVLHCNHLGNTWKPLVLMTRHFDYCSSAREGDNQSVRSSAPVVSRCFPGGYNVKLYISRGRLAWWLLAFLHSANAKESERSSQRLLYSTHRVGLQNNPHFWIRVLTKPDVNEQNATFKATHYTNSSLTTGS